MINIILSILFILGINIIHQTRKGNILVCSSQVYYLEFGEVLNYFELVFSSGEPRVLTRPTLPLCLSPCLLKTVNLPLTTPLRRGPTPRVLCNATHHTLYPLVLTIIIVIKQFVVRLESIFKVLFSSMFHKVNCSMSPVNVLKFIFAAESQIVCFLTKTRE